jgi:hypothetical protein
MRWFTYVACMGVTLYTDTKLITVERKGRGHLTDSGADKRTILKRILENYVVKMWTKKTIANTATTQTELISDKCNVNIT